MNSVYDIIYSLPLEILNTEDWPVYQNLSLLEVAESLTMEKKMVADVGVLKTHGMKSTSWYILGVTLVFIVASGGTMVLVQNNDHHEEDYVRITLGKFTRIFTESSQAEECRVNNADFIVDLLDHPCAGLGFSQGNQDCMLDTIFDNLGTTEKYFVEYGFNTKHQCSGSGPNTCKLWKDGWTGLLLDGDNQNASINLHNHFLYQDNIVDILKQYNVPRDLDFLSSDMDSHDFFVLASILEHYQPRVVTTEYNANWPVEYTISQIDPSLSEDLWNISKENFNFRQCIWGASASAFRQLMERHGYVLIGVTPGLDLFWAKNNLLDCYNVPAFSSFVDTMNLGKLVHAKQSNTDYVDWLLDTGVWLETRNMSVAREAAGTAIASMIHSGAPLPCFEDLSVNN